MGPLTGELQSGKGGEMGLFPPKCFGGDCQEPGMPKPGTSRWCGGISGASCSWMGRGSQKLKRCWEMIGKEKLFIFSILRAFPAGEGNDKRRETIPGSCSRAVPPVSLPHLSGADAERGCSAHLVLPPRTLEATPLLSQFLSEATELPQLP